MSIKIYTPLSNPPPICRECAFNEPYKGGGWWHKYNIPEQDTCSNPDYVEIGVITGKLYKSTCAKLRAMGSPCGPYGKGFKAK